MNKFQRILFQKVKKDLKKKQYMPKIWDEFRKLQKQKDIYYNKFKYVIMEIEKEYAGVEVKVAQDDTVYKVEKKSKTVGEKSKTSEQLILIEDKDEISKLQKYSEYLRLCQQVEISKKQIISFL